MPVKQRRFLGDLDAATDAHFRDHFVESLDLERILTSESDIIYGSKGVGKTALRRALSELNKSLFYATKTIDLDRISFSQVHSALNGLKDITRTEITSLARNTWRNVLAMYCIEVVANQLADSNELRKSVDKLIDQEHFKGVDSNHRIISQIESFLLRIADFGCDNSTAPLGLSEGQLRVINRFPSNPEVEPLLERCSKLVNSSQKCVLICIDGFDSIVDHTPESRKAIFAGLIDAIHKCSKDPLLSNSFCFKAFLPQELADDAQVVWDADKYILNTRYLKWTVADFQSFLLRRMRPYAKSKSSQFFNVWHEYMPHKIKNETHGIDEPSFDYILRHTLYRPRQLLTHLQRILDAWDEKSTAFKVDPSFIPQIVANTNVELARYVVNQLELRHQGLGVFLQSWHGNSNIITVGEFQERIKKIFQLKTTKDLNDLFDDLFNFGIFGISKRKNVEKITQSTCFGFGYVSDRFPRYIHTAVQEKDLVALSPMFHEYCGCIASEYGPIIPVEIC